MRNACLVIGIVLTASVVFTMVQSMLIPRVRRRPISRIVLTVVALAVRAPLSLMRNYTFQDRWLSGAAGLAMLLQLVIYVVLLIFSMALIILGTSPLTFGDSLYQAGATVTTLGIVQPVTNASTVACFIGAFLGLVVIAVFIGYLMAIYGAYSDRESPMTRLSLLAGEPAWGPQILVRSHALGLGSNPIGNESWISWTCDLRVNSLVNPVLEWFRSTSPNRHWCVSLLALLDATALQITLSNQKPDAQSIMLVTEGTLALNAIGNPRKGLEPVTCNWELERILLDPDSVADPGDPGITREEWDHAIDYLISAGVPAPKDRDRAWQRFATVRSFYAPVAQQIACTMHAIPAPWSGPRTPPLAIQWPDMAQTGVQRLP